MSFCEHFKFQNDYQKPFGSPKQEKKKQIIKTELLRSVVKSNVLIFTCNPISEIVKFLFCFWVTCVLIVHS